jgi:uncharacterized membrane protein YciS (DUF1049 family)
VKSALWVLMIVALVVVLAGALNHETEVTFDYLVGSTPAVSLFWLALGSAAALALAGIAGWAVAVASASAARHRLEAELEATYRRLRDCEARLPQAPAREAAGGVAADASGVARTAALPAPASEAATEVAEPSAGEATTEVAEAPANEARTAITEPPGESVES